VESRRLARNWVNSYVRCRRCNQHRYSTQISVAWLTYVRRESRTARNAASFREWKKTEQMELETLDYTLDAADLEERRWSLAVTAYRRTSGNCRLRLTRALLSRCWRSDDPLITASRRVNLIKRITSFPSIPIVVGWQTGWEISAERCVGGILTRCCTQKKRIMLCTSTVCFRKNTVYGLLWQNIAFHKVVPGILVVYRVLEALLLIPR